MEDGVVPCKMVVTGIDEEGRSRVESTDNAVKFFVPGGDGMVFHELWSTGLLGHTEDAGKINNAAPFRMLPAPGGTRARIVDFPPARLTGDKEAPVPTSHMHRTDTLDYGFVLSGEICLLLETEEIVLRAGEVIIQRETEHAWVNRSSKPCRVAFVLVDTKG
jgi:mannose-6-phosphate isomerase-like protein (cupin superfamily)